MVNIRIPGRPGFIALILVVVKKRSYNIGKNIHNLKKKTRIQSDPQNFIQYILDGIRQHNCY